MGLRLIPRSPRVILRNVDSVFMFLHMRHNQYSGITAILLAFLIWVKIIDDEEDFKSIH
jgi:hypothetical protein